MRSLAAPIRAETAAESFRARDWTIAYRTAKLGEMRATDSGADLAIEGNDVFDVRLDLSRMFDQFILVRGAQVGKTAQPTASSCRRARARWRCCVSVGRIAGIAPLSR
jgi:hypothetical protein